MTPFLVFFHKDCQAYIVVDETRLPIKKAVVNCPFCESPMRVGVFR